MYIETDIGIIGAGISGTYCASLLKEAGFDVTLVEKSRGTGGRSSSKRLDNGGSADLGAGYFNITQPELENSLSVLINKGVIQRWEAADINGYPAYTGVPKMSAITRYLLGDAPLLNSTRVHHIERCNHGWLLRDDSYQAILFCKTLIITAPAAQTAALLVSPQVPSQWLVEAHQASALSAPQWAMMITTAPSTVDHETSSLITNLDHPAIETIVLDSAKPQRQSSSPTWVIHARRSWSQLRLDTDKSTVQQQLLEAFEEIMGFSGDADLPHRWLLGQHSPINGDHCRWNASIQLGIAADWLYQGNIEGALMSAKALSDSIIACR